MPLSVRELPVTPLRAESYPDRRAGDLSLRHCPAASSSLSSSNRSRTSSLAPAWRSGCGRDLLPSFRMADGTKTQFLNVDLELRATNDLTELVQAFEPGAMALNCMAVEDGYFANLELASEPTEAEAAIRSFVALIDELPPRARALWNEVKRDFSIGVQAGFDSFKLRTRADTRSAQTRRQPPCQNHVCRIRLCGRPLRSALVARPAGSPAASPRPTGP